MYAYMFMYIYVNTHIFICTYVYIYVMMQIGRGCKLGENYLQFEYIANTPQSSKINEDYFKLQGLIVNEETTVLHLKEQILATWMALASFDKEKWGKLTPITANHIRLKGSKVKLYIYGNISMYM
jgi:hypothetical protein